MGSGAHRCHPASRSHPRRSSSHGLGISQAGGCQSTSRCPGSAEACPQEGPASSDTNSGSVTTGWEVGGPGGHLCLLGRPLSSCPLRLQAPPSVCCLASPAAHKDKDKPEGPAGPPCPWGFPTASSSEPSPSQTGKDATCCPPMSEGLRRAVPPAHPTHSSPQLSRTAQALPGQPAFRPECTWQGLLWG